MAWLAGEKITAARLSQDSDGITLTNSTPTSTAERDWGTETITFANPGVAVKVTAQVTGRCSSTTAAAVQNTKVAISFDGGSTFTTGPGPGVNALDGGATGTGRAAVTTGHHRTGTPTGNIVIKARVASSAATTPIAEDGFLTAVMVPQ